MANDHADRHDPRSVDFDVVTLALMRAGGVSPIRWVNRLERRTRMVGDQNLLIEMLPSSQRRSQAQNARHTERRRFDLLSVMDDGGVWRVTPSGHIEIAPGMNWLARTTLDDSGDMGGIHDRAMLSIDTMTLPDTVLAMLPGRPLSDLVAMPGAEGAIMESVSSNVGVMLEVVVDAPWTTLRMR